MKYKIISNLNLNIFKVTFILIFLTLFTGCNTQTPNTNNILNTKTLNTNKHLIKGKVEFPELKESFAIKSNFEKIVEGSTISIMYPHENQETPNKTISSGLTDELGNFEIETDSLFDPEIGEIFILEAIKRIENKELMTIRTYIQWSNEGWISMTTPNLVLSTKTTALSLIANYTVNNISVGNTIGKIDYSSGTSVITNNIGNVTPETINEVSDKVKILLTQGKDSFAFIRFVEGEYIIEDRNDLGQLIQTGNCEGCNLINIDLTNYSLSGIKLTNSILKGQNLSNLDLTNSDLSGTNMENCTLSNIDFNSSNMFNVNLKNSVINNTNFSNSFLENSDFSYSFLTNVTFSSGSNLKNSNLSNLIEVDTFTLYSLSNSILTGANLSNLILENINLSNKDLSDVKFNNSILTNTIFLNSILTNSDFSGTNVAFADFENSNLSYSNFSDTIVNNSTNFNFAYLELTDFTNFNFSNSNFSGALFYSKDFSNMNLSNANFEYAVFIGSNFTGSISDNVNFSNALFNQVIWDEEYIFEGEKICVPVSIGYCN